jgi:ferredoxin-type protein NapH
VKGLDKEKEASGSTGMSRREFFSTILFGGAVAFLGSRMEKTLLPVQGSVVRPPGAVLETDFLALCSRCGRCVVVCPNAALQLQGIENGLANFLTPKLTPVAGSCILPRDGCKECMEACPVGALRDVDFSTVPLENLSSLIKMGTVELDTDLCIPYAQEQSCLACSEVCPIEGAITMKGEEEPRKPEFDREVCVGCGACVNACPALPKALVLNNDGSKRFEVRR